MKDYYKILGVEKGASQDEIKKAFRKMAHQYHPDKQGGDEAKFKEANEAYSVLGDDAKRKQYDQFGSAGPGMGGNGFQGGQGFGGFDFSQFSQGFGGQNGNFEFDLGDVFSSFFGGGQSARTKRGDDVQVTLDLDFKESVFGATKTISVYLPTKCSTCDGHGAEPGSAVDQCKTCGGQGKVRHSRQSILGAIQTVVECPDCHGRGTIPRVKCPKCKGAGITKEQVSFDVKVPPGTSDGDTLRVPGKGEAIRGGTNGDLYARLRVRNATKFKKQGNDLVTSLDVPLSDSLLGAKVPLSTLDGDVTLDVPAGARHGDVLRIKGKGVPSGRSRGDILVTLDVKVPKKLSKKAKELAEELKKEGM
jgi:molecular chaperone DnaJ